MPIAIKVENLSKIYQLGQIGTGTISRDLERWYAKARGRKDPFLKIGETNDRTIKGSSDMVWSLKDINFEIEQGDAVGIIGKNGAGKSTLLKILSRVTSPTKGKITGNGRIASLLEVGTGFHPDLTGRENIYLNGAILGMRKKEITRKFDAIVDFAGVERYIDTPVKRYSSGMYVRLAFAVAAYLESEILIIDEVLAVGDTEFQKKCLGKMGEVSKGEGRTVLFVSHNLSSIKILCTKGLLMANGILAVSDTITNVINAYNNEKSFSTFSDLQILNSNKKAWLTGFLITADKSENEETYVSTFMDSVFKLNIEAVENIPNVQVGIGINDLMGVRLFTIFSRFSYVSYQLLAGSNTICCKVKTLPLKPGTYNAEVFIGNDYETLDYYNHGLSFEIKQPSNYNSLLPDYTQGNICVEQKWFSND